MLNHLVDSFWSQTNYNTGYQSYTLNDWLESAHLDNSKALFSAIVNNNRPAVKRLLVDGVNFDKRNEEGKTPLAVAMKHDLEDIACDLVDAGAYIDFGMPRLLERVILAIVSKVQ
jgi:ankyrin repeat protein